MWVGWDGGWWLAGKYGRIMKVGWRRWGSGWRGQEESMEMQIASFNSIARLSFDVK